MGKKKMSSVNPTCPPGAPTDGELLKRFLARRDEAAFAALVGRHGQMVLNVCYRVARNPHDAEDAFQATFLVLAQKAARVVPERVGSWLCGVAYRTALQARGLRARRRSREMSLEDQPEPTVEAEPAWDDLRPVLDQELSRLPEKYRLVLVLCGLEGRSRKDVARELKLPVGTLSSRLALARKMLASRLARRGITLSASALFVLLGRHAAAHPAAPALLASAVGAAGVAGNAAAPANAFSAPVVALARGVSRALRLARAAVATCVVLAGLAGIGVGLGTWAALGGRASTNPVAAVPDAAACPANGEAAEPEAPAPAPRKVVAYSDPEPPPLPPDLIATFESCDKRL
jgi:RNA polymerase sigma factor (sigma-70 family)